jgi:hypothetical protein
MHMLVFTDGYDSLEIIAVSSSEEALQRHAVARSAAYAVHVEWENDQAHEPAPSPDYYEIREVQAIEP